MLPNITEATDTRYQGSAETAAAWTSPDWDAAVSRVDVLGIYVGPAANGGSTGTDGILVNLVDMARRFGKKIAVEIGAGGGSVSTTLDGTASSGQKVIPLTSTASIASGAPFKITTGATTETGVVDTVSDGVSITAVDNLANTYLSGSTFAANCAPLTGAASAALDLAGHMAYITALGGTIDYLQMDGPMWRWMHLPVPKTAAQAAVEVVSFMQTIHAVYPAVQFGVIQTPSAFYDVSEGATFTALMDRVGVVGETIAFHHVDHPYEFMNDAGALPPLGNQTSGVVAMQSASIARGVPFGLKINSAWGSGSFTSARNSDLGFEAPVDPSGEEFQKRCLWHAELLRRKIAAGVLSAPDNVLIQSFYYHPRDMAPDTTAYTFCDTVLKAKAVVNSDVYKATVGE